MPNVKTKATYDTCVTLMTYPEAYFLDAQGETKHYRWRRHDFTTTNIPYVLQIKSGALWVSPSKDLLPQFHRGKGNGNPGRLDLGHMFVDKGFLPSWWDEDVKKDVVRQLSPYNNVELVCKR